ncbi:unnamed protein product [Paramecium pentaurelia]|uniref:RING-type domain-containing protein n=1 Tax=Paramecium pentaurelia TaxID=43138 RepID=A0A8S1TJ92_9CILI|nr:unnamed protein product [Paramecium pentaurelia]
MAVNNEVNEYTFEEDFQILEIPQLLRQNGVYIINQENHGYLILDKPVDSIFEEEKCPICFESSNQLYPLKCGHTFCQYDIEKMIEISKLSQNLIQCPLCRAQQNLDSYDEVLKFQQQNIKNSQKLDFQNIYK